MVVLRYRLFLYSEVLEEYCLGTLSGERLEMLGLLASNPKVVEELQKVQSQIIVENRNDDFPHSASAKQKKFEEIPSIDKTRTQKFVNSVLIKPFSDPGLWSEKISPLHPDPYSDNIFLIQIREENKTFQLAVWVKKGFEIDFHDDMVEIFIILEGACTCLVGEKTISLKPGDFLEIPPFISHSLEVTSPKPVVAILQRIYL